MTDWALHIITALLTCVATLAGVKIAGRKNGNGNGLAERLRAVEIIVANHESEIHSLRERWHKVGEDAMGHLLAKLKQTD